MALQITGQNYIAKRNQANYKVGAKVEKELDKTIIQLLLGIKLLGSIGCFYGHRNY